jgi:hypothetical protein
MASLFFAVRTDQASCMVLFTSLHTFSIGSKQALAVTCQSVRNWSVAIAIPEPH